MQTSLLQGHLLHGGDYNPEQWLSKPEILKKDIQCIKEAGCNTVTLGVFSWSTLEPAEGEFHLQWLEEIVETLYSNGIYVIMSTPSGARPQWMAKKYPEVLRVDGERRRALYGERHNHCYTSPVYREKVKIINKKLADKFANHPAVILWHISNEYGGECHCPLCQEKFRSWVKDKYATLDALNESWSTTFWSHTYQSFDQVESPSPIGEMHLHGLNLDWKRFVTDQTVDFAKAEIAEIKKVNPQMPVTTNMMYYYDGLNYQKFADILDVISWDNYPTWHKEPEADTAADCGMYHDLMRSLKDQPFFLMENSPGMTNWQPVSKLKKPGMHQLSALQTVAHGGDGVLYFQMRQSRGASEKFHGAVINHSSDTTSRSFKEVKKVGEVLSDISEICEADTPVQAAVIYDWENKWAMEDAQGPRNQNLYYKESVQKSYKALRKQGMNVDVITTEHSLASYKVIAAPMLYLMREEFAAKIEAFVAAGGTFILTYWSGIVDEHDLCYMDGTPHNLEEVFGICSTEIDGLYDWEENQFIVSEEWQNNLKESYTCKNLCALIELKGAKTVATYGSDFYVGTSAVTKNTYKKGHAYYVCADAEQEFYDDLYRHIVKEANVDEKVSFPVPSGVEVCIRKKANEYYVFIQNFTTKEVEISLNTDDVTLLYGESTECLPAFGSILLKTDRLM